MPIFPQKILTFGDYYINIIINYLIYNYFYKNPQIKANPPAYITINNVKFWKRTLRQAPKIYPVKKKEGVWHDYGQIKAIIMTMIATIVTPAIIF